MSKGKGQRPRWLRRTLWVLAAVLLVASLMLVVAEVIVRQPAVRAAIRDFVVTEAEERFDLAVSLDELHLSLFHRYVRVEGLAVGTAGNRPLAEIESLEVEWRWSSIWDRPITLSQLHVSGPRLDLGAPRPTFATDSTSPDSAEPFALVIEELRLLDGRIDGPVVPEEIQSWIADWWLQDVAVEGHYGPQTLAVALESTASWLRTDEIQVDLEIDASLDGPQEGPWQLSELQIRGEGLQAEASAEVGLTAAEPFGGRFTMTLEPDRLIPVPPAEEPIAIDGEFNWRHQTARLELRAPEIPVALASPWLPEGFADPVVTDDWTTALNVDLTLDGLNDGPVGGAEMTLWRGEETWLSAEIELPADGSTEVAKMMVEAQVLPDLPGRRSAVAVLEAPTWSQIDQLQIRDSRIEVVDTDVARLQETLASVWPEPLPALPDGVSPGTIQVSASVIGPPDDLQADVEASWRDGEGTWLDLAGEASRERVLIRSIEGVVADRQFQGSGSVDLPLPIAAAELEVEITRPVAEIESVSMSASLDAGVLRAEVLPTTSNGAASRIVTTLPLATLAQVSQLTDTLADLPLVKSSGPLQIDWQTPEAEWAGLLGDLSGEEPALSSLRFSSTGSLALDPRRPLAAEGRISLDGLQLAREDLQVATDGPVSLQLASGELILEPARLVTAGGTLELEVWSALDTGWQPGTPPVEALERFRVEANGLVPMALASALADEVLTDGDLQVGISIAGTPDSLSGEVRAEGRQARLFIGGPEGIELSDPSLELLLEEDRVRLTQGRLRIDGGEVALSAEAPLATVQALAGVEESEPTPDVPPIDLRLELAPTDWAATLGKLGLEEVPDAVELGGRAELAIDPTRPLGSSGWVEIAPLQVIVGDHEVTADAPLRLDLADGLIDITRFEIAADGQPFSMSGSVALNPEWDPGEPATALVQDIDLAGEGTLAAALLNPFLAGGRADGLLEIELQVAGTLEEPRGRMRIQGPEASVGFTAPYVAMLEAPELDLELVDGRAHVRDGRVRLNDGDVELEGSLGLEGAELMAHFDGLRFRLDYGLFVKVDGDLDLTLDPQGRGRLRGDIIVDQGSLTRQISIDRDFITSLLSPIDLTGTEESLFDDIALDLRLETRRGVRVRNNVADLAVGWSGVRVGGTLLEPVIDGQFFVEPGGRAFLFGQTLRIDRGAITFPGQPGAEAVLDLETTSSLDDPSISRLAGDDALSLGQFDADKSLQTRAEDAAASFVSEQLATRIADFVPGARLTFRPILIFGEADPGARLTIGRDFSRYVTLAASIDLRNAERQTYLMEAHSIPKLPGLVVQVFTNDLEQEGATLQHRLRFGGYRRTAPTGPDLRRLEIDEVPGVKPRALRRAVGLAKGDRASDDDLFLAEVEVGEFLRAQGYPDAQVAVESMPVLDRPRKVDVEVDIDPGPRARYEFVGEQLSRPLQRSITMLYRSDFYEAQALSEMEAQTVRALRSLGHLSPEVEVGAENAFDAEGREERQVTVRMQGGQQVDLQELQIAGLSEAESAQVAASFPTQVQLIELASAEPAADRRLSSAVRNLGYLEPQIVGRQIEDGSRRLTVEVSPGPQSRVAEFRVAGVETERAEELGEAVTLEPGEPARRDRIAAAAMALERELQSEGFAKARVRPRVEAVEPDSPEALSVVFEVEPGTAYRVADSEIKGLRATSRRWATNVAEMESGAPLREDEVYAARSRLYETGLFTMVGTETIEIDRGEAEVVFDVEERPRFSAAYGFRWDSDQGTQGVVDAIDQNFLGRSITLGFRGLYKQDDWSVRLAAGVPRLFGSRAVLEIFGTFRDTFEELSDELFTTQFDRQDLESSLQIAYPFSRSVSGRFYGRYRVSELLVIEIDQDPIFPLPPTELEFRFKNPLVGTLWIYDSRDRELVLTAGSFASIDLSGTGDFLDSDFEYIRMFSQFNLYRRVGHFAGRRLGWAQSLRLGLADSFAQELDRDDRFFAGGQYSVRGYPTDSLGPVEILGDDLTRPLGGKTLVVINQEVRADLLGPVGGIAFFDLGNVWEDTAEFSSSLFKSLGVGLRADTPVGLLRLDYAIPLDRREEDPSYQLYFGFGNTF